jgi:hypothetical protein
MQSTSLQLKSQYFVFCSTAEGWIMHRGYSLPLFLAVAVHRCMRVVKAAEFITAFALQSLSMEVSVRLSV